MLDRMAKSVKHDQEQEWTNLGFYCVIMSFSPNVKGWSIRFLSEIISFYQINLKCKSKRQVVRKLNVLQ